MSEPEDLLRWLATDELAAPDGHCLSWWNPVRPGFGYPEITGLLLHLLSQEAVAPQRRAQLRSALLHTFDAGGGVTRHGLPYTFDTAMALRGLLADGAVRASGNDSDVLHSGRWQAAVTGWAELLVTAAGQGNPAAGGVPPGDPDPSTRWSLSFGAHQAKVCGALLDYRQRFGPLAGLDEAVEALARAALDVQDSAGRFRIHSRSAMTYTHSHCYAVEGLLMRAAAGGGTRSGAVLEGAQWLADVQQPDGGLRAWHDGRTASGARHADATAQALRIWVLTDPVHFAEPAARARDFLWRLWAPPRGLRYADTSADVNSWATIFAAQALSWQIDPARADPAGIV